MRIPPIDTHIIEAYLKRTKHENRFISTNLKPVFPVCQGKNPPISTCYKVGNLNRGLTSVNADLLQKALRRGQELTYLIYEALHRANFVAGEPFTLDAFDGSGWSDKRIRKALAPLSLRRSLFGRKRGANGRWIYAMPSKSEFLRWIGVSRKAARRGRKINITGETMTAKYIAQALRTLLLEAFIQRKPGTHSLKALSERFGGCQATIRRAIRKIKDIHCRHQWRRWAVTNPNEFLGSLGILPETIDGRHSLVIRPAGGDEADEWITRLTAHKIKECFFMQRKCWIRARLPNRYWIEASA